jgi:hypothetical protein
MPVLLHFLLSEDYHNISPKLSLQPQGLLLQKFLRLPKLSDMAGKLPFQDLKFFL